MPQLAAELSVALKQDAQVSSVFSPRTAVKVPAGAVALPGAPPVNVIVGTAVYNVPPAVIVMLAMPPPAFRTAVPAAPTPVLSEASRVNTTVGAVVYPAPAFETGIVMLATEVAGDFATDLPAGQAEQMELPAAEK